MNTQFENRITFLLLPFLMLLFFMAAPIANAQSIKQSREVIEGYIGWVNNPDSLGVYIDDTWSEAEKDSVRAGIARWNDAGCTPKFKEVSSSDDAHVTVTQGNPGEGNAGLYEWNEDDDGKVTSATITIAEDTSPLSIKEVVTHELGHAIGLDDTTEADNTGDVMKGSGPTNGTDGNLSQHDSTEMRQAAQSITAIGEDAIPHEKAIFPGQSILPGEFSDFNFLLPDYYPPGTSVTMIPVEDPLLFVEYAYIEENQLWAGVFSDPMHGSGKIYFDIFIDPPIGEPYHFWGVHYINRFPVPPTPFECPFEAIQFGDHVIVNWQDLHSYPFESPLRSHLVLDDYSHFNVKPNADYYIPVEPGMHTLQLFVDDYQGNSASYSRDILISDNTPPWEEPFEDYVLGSDIVGQGGWGFWFGGEASPSARVTDEMVHVGGKALKILGKPDMTGDDIVHQFSGCTSGVWELSAWQFIPEQANTGSTYITLLNQYGLTLEECNWSTQLAFNSETNVVESQFEGATLPLVKGEWALIEVILDFDNDLQTISYNGDLLSTKSWTQGILPEGQNGIATLNLFSGDLNGYVYYDDISLNIDDNFGLEDLNVFQVSYDWGEISQTNSRVGLITITYTPDEQTRYFNAFTINEFGNIYWLGQNFLPEAIYSPEAQKTTMPFDLMELGIEPGETIDFCPLWVILSPEPLLAIPDLPPVDIWPVYPVNELIDNTCGGGGGPDLTISGTSTPLIWPHYINPLNWLSEIEKLVYRGCNVPNIDLDNSGHPHNEATGYAGDNNACCPAGMSNSIKWLEGIYKDNDPSLNTGQTHREVLEDLSGEMGREPNSGPDHGAIMEGKMKYAQKHKLPIRTKFQYIPIAGETVGDIRPEGSSYTAENQTGDSGKPDWDWLMGELEDGEDVEMNYSPWDEANNRWAPSGSHTVVITGAIQLSSGFRGLWIKHDRDQDNENPTHVVQDPTAVTVDGNGWITLPTISRNGFPIRVYGLVSESYDNTVTYRRASGTLQDPDGNPVETGNVEIRARRWDDPDDELSTADGTIKYKIIDGVGFFDIDWDDFENPLQPGDRIQITFFDGEHWVTRIVIINENGDPVWLDVTLEEEMTVDLEFTQWQQITIPPHKTLKVEYLDVGGCGNTDIVQWNGDDWYIPAYGFWNHNSTGTVNEISNDTDHAQFKRFHCDDRKGFTLKFTLVESTGNTTGSNQNEYAVVNVGGDDYTNVEFGEIEVMNYTFTYEVGAQLGDFPQTMGEGGVQNLELQFESYDNVYWCNMELQIRLLNVGEGGNLTVDVTDQQSSKIIVPIAPGQIMVNIPMGAIPVSGLHALTLSVDATLTFGIDCLNFSSVYEPITGIDFGDAPDSPYPTLLASDGARHQIDGVTYLGSLIDPEPDGQPTAAADGDDLNNLDDEDGVTFLWPLRAGNPCKIKVTATGNNALFSGWIDFNANGSWADPEDHVFADINLIAGDNFLTFIAPANAAPGNTYARFRYSHQANLSFTGEAQDGEVEDYIVEVDDYGDLKWIQPPDLPGLHANDQVRIADDWICGGGQVTAVRWWGNYELVNQGIDHFILNIYDDMDCMPGTELASYMVPYAQANESNTGNLIGGLPLYAYEYILPAPFDQVQGQTYWLALQSVSTNQDNPAIWRWCESSRWFWPINCGAVEWIYENKGWQTIFWLYPEPGQYSDMAFVILSEEPPPPNIDFGDAPDDPYPTLMASDGARHISDGITYLGTKIDVELDGQPTVAADGDDLNNLDDEDGVVFRTPLVAGEDATIKVLASVDGFLNVWFDVNQNGSWADASDHVFVDRALVAGWNTLTLPVPNNAKQGNTYIRFRFDSQGGLNYYGLAQNGEVEDYLVKVYPENWGFIYTPVPHTILVPLNVVLNGLTLSANDAIGVFFNNSGVEVCGGAAIWDGTNNQVVLAYGDDNTTPALKEGFADGEVLSWRVYHAATGIEEVVSVDYDPAMPQSDGKFASYGLSGLLQINGLTVTATANPTSLCQGDDVQLDVIITGGSGTYTYSWTSTPAGFFSNIKNPTDTPSQDITYHVTVTDGGANASSSVDVSVQPQPVAVAGANATICDTDTYDLNGTAANYSSKKWTTDGDGTFSNPNINNPEYYPGSADISAGSVKLTFTAYPVNPCTAPASASIILTIQPSPVADAGNDGSVCAGESYVLSGLPANASSVLWETDGDGTFDNSGILSPTYYPGTTDISSGQVGICLTAYPVVPCQNSHQDCITLTILESQTVHLHDGWNGLSSYLTPYNSNDNYALFNPVIGNLIVAYNFSGAFWPGNTNTLNWIDHSGYVVKMLDDDDMVFCGDRVSNLVINLNPNWNIIPVLADHDVDVTSVFDNQVDFKIVMEVAHYNMYWPAWGINTLGDMESGKSYFVCMNTADAIDFGNASPKTSPVEPHELVNTSPWNDAVNSPAGHVIAFSADACSNFKPGDMVGAFTSTGLCAGMINAESQAIGLRVNGDDPYTAQLDGFANDEPITYRLYRPESGEQFNLSVVYDDKLDYSGRYHDFALSAIIDVKMAPTGIQSLTDADIMIYPNPSHGIFNVDGISCETEVMVYDAFGSLIYSKTTHKSMAINLSDQPAGIYLIQIKTLNGTHYQKIIIN